MPAPAPLRPSPRIRKAFIGLLLSRQGPTALRLQRPASGTPGKRTCKLSPASQPLPIFNSSWPRRPRPLTSPEHAAGVQTENADTVTNYSADRILDIPNPGGDLTYIAQTAPGIVMNTQSGYGNFSANGLPGTSNLFSVNGQNFNDPFLSLNNSGASNLLLGFNDVAEANVITNAYSGQYGQYAGAQVTYITKSDNNQFHGDAIWMWNGRALNADYEGVRVALPTATSLILAPSPQFQLRRCSRERRMYSRGMRTNFTVFLQTLAKAHVALGCNEGRSEALREGMASGVFTPVQRRFTGMFWNVYNLAE
jgi:hypothetical protein